MLLDGDIDIQISGRRARLSGFTFVPNTNSGAVVHAGRNIYCYRPLFAPAARAPALLADGLCGFTIAAAGAAGRDLLELPEDIPLHPPDLA